MSKVKSTMNKEIISFIKTILFSLFIVYVLNNYIFRPVKVKGDSMIPTLTNNEYGISSILSLKMEGIERFDIVIIYMPETKEYLVKRVIGLPNEKVSYKAGKLYINGEFVKEPFLSEANINNQSLFTEDVNELIVESDGYFCLGDNRPYSKDSRYYGSFNKNQIVSKDIYVIYPFNQIGRMVK